MAKPMQHDVFLALEALGRKLDRVIALLSNLIVKGAVMAQELDDLTAEVTRNTEVDASARALLTGLSAKLDAAIAAGNPAAIQDLANSLRASNDTLAAAVTANTPVE